MDGRTNEPDIQPVYNGNDWLEIVESLRSPSLKLLAGILKVARDDWVCVNEGTEPFCDRTHNILCDKEHFDNGIEELREFFYSHWFERICDEFDFNPEGVREYMDVH